MIKAIKDNNCFLFSILTITPDNNKTSGIIKIHLGNIKESPYANFTSISAPKPRKIFIVVSKLG